MKHDFYNSIGTSDEKNPDLPKFRNPDFRILKFEIRHLSLIRISDLDTWIYIGIEMSEMSKLCFFIL